MTIKAERRPRAGAANLDLGDALSATPKVAEVTDNWLELPAYVIRVEVNDLGGTRTYVYRSLLAAERAVERATKRGRQSALTLCSLVPVGVS